MRRAQPIALGSTATLRSSGAVIPVGYDGEAYADDLLPANAATIEQPDGRRCSVTFPYRPVSGEIPVIGPLVCKE
jgi:outer membrane usher protein